MHLAQFSFVYSDVKSAVRWTTHHFYITAWGYEVWGLGSFCTESVSWVRFSNKICTLFKLSHPTCFTSLIRTIRIEVLKGNTLTIHCKWFHDKKVKCVINKTMPNQYHSQHPVNSYNPLRFLLLWLHFVRFFFWNGTHHNNVSSFASRAVFVSSMMLHSFVKQCLIAIPTGILKETLCNFIPQLKMQRAQNKYHKIKNKANWTN